MWAFMFVLFCALVTAQDPVADLVSSGDGEASALLEQFVLPSADASSDLSSIAATARKVSPLSPADQAVEADVLESLQDTDAKAKEFVVKLKQLNEKYNVEKDYLVNDPSAEKQLRPVAETTFNGMLNQLTNLDNIWTKLKDNCKGIAVCLNRAEKEIARWTAYRTEILGQPVIFRPLPWSVASVVISSLAFLGAFVILWLGSWQSSVGKRSSHVIVSIVLLAVLAVVRIIAHSFYMHGVRLLGDRSSNGVPFAFLRLALVIQVVIVSFFTWYWAKVASHMSETEEHPGWGLFRFALVVTVALTTMLLVITGIVSTVSLYQQNVDAAWTVWDQTFGGIALLSLSTTLVVIGFLIYRRIKGAEDVNHSVLAAFRLVLAAQITLVVASIFLLIYGILRGALPPTLTVNVWPISVLSDMFFYAAVLVVCYALGQTNFEVSRRQYREAYTKI